MENKCIDLKYAKLHLMKTTKFRSINIKILLKDEIKKEEITKRNFLTDYLLLTSKKYPTRKELALKIQELYSLFIGGYNTRIGNYLITKFSMTLLNPKYTEENMLDESIELLSQLIFNPNVTNQQFNQNCFNIVKNNLLNEIKTIKENPKSYAGIKMLEAIDKNANYAYHTYGYLEDLEKITPKNLYEYYQQFLTKSLVDIYVIGDFDSEKIVKTIKEKLNFKTIKKPKKDIYITHQKIRKHSKTIIQEDEFTQSKLAIGCKLANLTDFEKKYVINLYSMILGGGFNSKFMQIIREKKSLAYYINSSVSKADNLLIIQSGISYKNFNKVITTIKTIMKSITNGSITDLELTNSKTEYLSVLEEVNDNIDGIIDNEIIKNILNLDDLTTRKTSIQKVTKQDIIKVSKKVHLDTIYLLKEKKGGSNGKN